MFYSSDLIACGIARGDVIARGINQTTKHFAVCKNTVGLADYFSTDVVVCQRPSDLALLEHLKLCQSRGSLIVVDLDDDLFRLDPSAKDAYDFYSDPNRRQALRNGMEMADVVTVSTPYLASRVREECPNVENVVVIRNCVDAGHARIARQSFDPSQKKDEIVIMWHASHTHIIDCPIIEKALIQVLDANPKVRVQMYGNLTAESFVYGLGERNVSFEGWVTPLRLYFALAQADIGICPLANKPFNQSKSEIKWLEYGAVGVPCVVSPEEPYKVCRDGEDVVFATNETEWENSLNTLIDNPDYRKKIGATANVRVYDDYSHIERAATWAEVLTRAVSVRK